MRIWNTFTIELGPSGEVLVCGVPFDRSIIPAFAIYNEDDGSVRYVVHPSRKHVIFDITYRTAEIFNGPAIRKGQSVMLRNVRYCMDRVDGAVDVTMSIDPGTEASVGNGLDVMLNML